MRVHHAAGVGYQRAAGVYERSRPSYPLATLAAIADALPLERGRTVVDLGAGTGKFTRLLALTGAEVLAVEPVAEMRERLAELLPGVAVSAGTAEDTGLPAGCADAVVAAQSWHWFEADRALAEVERLLRPGGALVLVWNTYDTSVPWVRDYQDIYFRLAPRDLPSPPLTSGPGRAGDAGTAADTAVDLAADAAADAGPGNGWREVFAARPGWGAIEERHWPNPHSTTVADVVERMMSSSHIAVLDPARQERVRAELQEVLGSHDATRGSGAIDMPYTTDVYWARRV
ncbi:Methyltransferase domain-containing protein [Actinacidiphila yanglinensis]|uniref:Methyltransferase domain-containing protein n=1 Tax=Actinacidiphila yanglinensis TaxID=310779 RepID=A0A1H6CJ80_9ACTN|nr:class I SAM-dependent methyltransferase [Actinacidiphila yanglinensis]SEG73010.1 Methyltransferase domain-containing protein [Actinacidiphila yanglinensis]